MANAKPNTAAVCEALAKPLLEELGLTLWDLRFEKEGSGWFLRYFIDKEGGVDINDCEHFSRAIDPILDAADPIVQSYCLEVSSPGIEREMTKPWHFERYKGHAVTVRYIRPVDGVREFVGTILSHEGGTTVLRWEDKEISVNQKQTASIRLVDTYEYTKEEKDE